MDNKIYNLAYFVGVVDRPMLWYNLYRLKGNLYKFNGKKLITLCVMGDDPATQHYMSLSDEERVSSVENSSALIDKIKYFLDDPSIEYFIVSNSFNCETPAFMDLMAPKLASSNPDEATFYAHTKGIRYPHLNGVDVRMALWAGNMYDQCLVLDYEEKLWDEGYSVYGAYRQDRTVVIEQCPPVDWHYAGAFFWFKHVPFFQRNWDTGYRGRGWVESLPGLVFRPEEAYSPLHVPRYFKMSGEFYELTVWKGYYESLGITLTQCMNSYGFDGNEHDGFKFSLHDRTV